MAKPAKTGKSKARAGHGRLRRISKANRQRARKGRKTLGSPILKARRLYRTYLDVPDLSPLPFSIHREGLVFPTWGDRDPPLGEYQWDKAAQEIAKAALLNGHLLLVPVRPDCVAWATCAIVRVLNLPVCVYYTSIYGCLMVTILESERPEQVGSDADDDN